MRSIDDLEQMRAIDPSGVDRDTLVDIQDVKIRMDLPQEERVLDFIEQIKNPFLFKCGGLVVQSVFADTTVTLTDRLKQYFRSI